MTDKKLKTKKRLLQQRVSFNNDMTVSYKEDEDRRIFLEALSIEPAHKLKNNSNNRKDMLLV
jgi:hypothetical protein